MQLGNYQHLSLIGTDDAGNRQVYPVTYLLYGIFMANLAGANSWDLVHDYYTDKLEDLNECYVKLVNVESPEQDFATPSMETLAQGLALLEPQEFAASKSKFLAAFFPTLADKVDVTDSTLLRGVKKLGFMRDLDLREAEDEELQITLNVNAASANDSQESDTGQMLKNLGLDAELVQVVAAANEASPVILSSTLATEADCERVVQAVKQYAAQSLHGNMSWELNLQQAALQHAQENVEHNMSVLLNLVLHLAYYLKCQENKSVQRVMFLLGNRSPQEIYKRFSKALN